jgi:hypothetical protein
MFTLVRARSEQALRSNESSGMARTALRALMRPTSLTRSINSTVSASSQEMILERPPGPSADRKATNLARCRTSSRNSRVGVGATHASGSWSIRSRSAGSVASRTSFFTRRDAKLFTPNGFAKVPPHPRPPRRPPPSTSRRWPRDAAASCPQPPVTRPGASCPLPHPAARPAPPMSGDRWFAPMAGAGAVLVIWAVKDRHWPR